MSITSEITQRRDLADEVAWSMLTLDEKAAIDRANAIVTELKAYYAQLYGGMEKIPPEVDNGIIDEALSRVPGSAQAADKYSRLEDRLLTAGNG